MGSPPSQDETRGELIVCPRTVNAMFAPAPSLGQTGSGTDAAARQAMAPVEVTGERMSARLLRDGFYDRRNRGFGQYLDPDQVERLACIVSQTSQMLRMMNGIQVRCPAVGPCRVTGTTSCLSLFVDGVRQRNILLDERVSPSNVYAVEVYPRRSALPQEFVDPVSQCGAIVVWTKSRAP